MYIYTVYINCKPTKVAVLVGSPTLQGHQGHPVKLPRPSSLRWYAPGFDHPTRIKTSAKLILKTLVKNMCPHLQSENNDKNHMTTTGYSLQKCFATVKTHISVLNRLNSTLKLNWGSKGVRVQRFRQNYHATSCNYRCVVYVYIYIHVYTQKENLPSLIVNLDCIRVMCVCTQNVYIDRHNMHVYIIWYVSVLYT